MRKKILCVLLCAVIIVSGVSFCIAAKNDEVPFLIASDLHYQLAPQKVPNTYPGDKYYCCSGYSPSLLSESYAVLHEFLRQAAETDAQFILLPGDLTNDGTNNQLRNMAGFLSDFERQTGKQVYVVPGNHDFHNRVSVQSFKELYADLGYAQALAVDAQTCSYTAELNYKYRLLAIDSTNHGGGEDGFTVQLLEWAWEQAQQAKKDGKTLIAMMHHNFLEHIRFETQLLPAFIVRPEIEMKMRFLDWGVRYVFTGHTHGQDVASFTDGANRTVYDIMTTSLVGYPCAYRSAVLRDDGLEYKTHRINGVDLADLPNGYTDELLDELQNDLNKIAIGYFAHAFEEDKERFIGEKALSQALTKFVGEKASQIIQPFFSRFMQTLFLPIYEPDTPDGRCLADLSRALGLTVPETEHRNVSDLAFYFICVFYAGDENLPYYDPQIQLFMQCVYTSMYDAMQTVNAQTRDALLADLRANFGDEALPYAVSAAGKLALGAVKDDRLLEMTLLMLSPLIESFSMDDDVPDNDGFLPAKTAQPDPVLQFLQQVFGRIYKFFEKYFAGFARILKKYPPFYKWQRKVDVV